MRNKEIGKLCFYLSMNFIHLGDGSCKEAQTAILHFHNLVGRKKSHKRCIFRHKCAICPPHCVPSTILVYSGTENVCFIMLFCEAFVRFSAVLLYIIRHLHDCFRISALFFWPFLWHKAACMTQGHLVIYVCLNFGCLSCTCDHRFEMHAFWECL